MNRIYTHEIAQEVRSIGGRYELDKEGVIDWEGSPILYAVGNAAVDSSCCGTWGCRYALVAGYVKRLRFGTDDEGNPLSEVLPIDDRAVRDAITDRMKQEEKVSQVIFL
jgi:hypothetical protein